MIIYLKKFGHTYCATNADGNADEAPSLARQMISHLNHGCAAFDERALETVKFLAEQHSHIELVVL